MKVEVLLKVDIYNLDINPLLKKYPTLRMYLSEFKRTKDGMFISPAELIRVEGKKDTVDSDSIDLRNALLDWSFNENYDFEREHPTEGKIHEVGDAKDFWSEHPEGFKFKFYKLCEL